MPMTALTRPHGCSVVTRNPAVFERLGLPLADAWRS
jgi:hypothetical protein